MSAETDRDPFALAREDESAGDPLIRKLFRQWIEENRFGSKADGQEALDASCDRMLDIEQEIADLPTQSVAGLAIKVYLHLFWAECSCHTGGAIRLGFQPLTITAPTRSRSCGMLRVSCLR